mgnify:CR=1 FL=1
MIKRPNVNLLSGLVLAIILLGVISAVTVYLNARTYRDLAFDFQRQYMTQLIAAESAEIIHEDADSARQLGLRIQSLPAFRTAFASGDDAEISAVLDAQYQQAPVTSNAVNLVGLYAFDINFRLLGDSTRRAADAQDLICPGLTSSAHLRQGARRLKPLYELCLYKGEPYLAALAPAQGPPQFSHHVEGCFADLLVNQENAVYGFIHPTRSPTACCERRLPQFFGFSFPYSAVPSSTFSTFSTFRLPRPGS